MNEKTKYRYKVADSYYRIWLKEEKRLVGEHRYIMEKHLKRRLKKDEVVHHRDGNGLNNKIDNLQLMNSKEHRQFHQIGKPRPCTTKHRIVNILPRVDFPNVVVSLRTKQYHLYKSKFCSICGNIYWMRIDNPYKTCSLSCGVKSAWQKGKYKNRKKKCQKR